jgi:coproporphyrinogen III oxidase-like Fe-S oxidoreductase
LGASSYLQGTRFARPRKLKQWEEYVDALEGNFNDDMQASTRASTPTATVDRLLDAIMLGLRLQQGIDLQWLQQHFGQECLRQVLQAMHNGRHVADGRAEVVGGGRLWSCEEALQVLDSDKGQLPAQFTVRLTDPRGLLTSNDIISDVFLQIDKIAAGKQAAPM